MQEEKVYKSAKMNLHQAVVDNDMYSLRILCTEALNDQKNKLESADVYGNTPLLKACYLSRYESASTLISFGAQVSAVNYFGQNALTLSTYSGNLDLVELLLGCRSYTDFNLSSIIPAICVATMCKHHGLVALFQNMDNHCGENLKTVHGLKASNIRDIFSMDPIAAPRPQRRSGHSYSQRQLEESHSQSRTQDASSQSWLEEEEPPSLLELGAKLMHYLFD